MEGETDYNDTWAASTATGLLAGLMAALVMTLVMSFLRWGPGIPTPAELVGDRMAPTFNAGEFLGLLQRFGGYNQLKQLGIGSVLAGQTVVGTLGGVVFANLDRRVLKAKPEAHMMRGSARPALLFVAALVFTFWIATLVALWPVLKTSFSGLPPGQASLATAIGALLSYAAYGFGLVWIYRFIRGRSLSAESQSRARVTVKRRAFLTAGVLAGLGAATAGALTRLYRLATFSYDGTQYIGPDVQPITPNDLFYVVTKNVIDPEVHKSLWRLQVAGMVEHPRDYSFEDLRALPETNQETTLMCISNWVGGGLMSNAVWKGVSLRSLIEAANPKQGVVEVYLRAVDGYTDTIPFEKAMEPTTIAAYEMNGEALQHRHGYPVRIIVPGMFGEKNVKWVTRIELLDYDAKGFYETQGWGPSFIVPTRARFDFPYYDQAIPFAARVSLKGIAFGGDRGIDRVEVSVDGGSTWRETALDYRGSRLTWALWSYDWKPSEPGEYKLVVRAADGSGAIQTAEDRGTVPEGATGYHRVTLRLEG